MAPAQPMSITGARKGSTTYPDKTPRTGHSERHGQAHATPACVKPPDRSGSDGDRTRDRYPVDRDPDPVVHPGPKSLDVAVIDPVDVGPGLSVWRWIRAILLTKRADCSAAQSWGRWSSRRLAPWPLPVRRAQRAGGGSRRPSTARPSRAVRMSVTLQLLGAPADSTQKAVHHQHMAVGADHESPVQATAGARE